MVVEKDCGAFGMSLALLQSSPSVVRNYDNYFHDSTFTWFNIYKQNKNQKNKIL